MSHVGDASLEWGRMCQEQTPPDLRVDRSGRRAWGYRRLRLATLMAFARKNKCSVTVRAPYVNLDPMKDEDEDSEDRQETSFVGMNEAAPNDDEWDDDYDVPSEHRNRNRTISKSIMQKLQGITSMRKERCITIFKALSYIDCRKINFRLFNPRGERAGVRLVFQITNAVLTHEALNKIDLYSFVREATLRLNQGKVLTFKVVIS